MADAITGTIASAATAPIFTYYYCIMIIVRASRALPVEINVRNERIGVLDWLPRIDVDRKHASLLLPCAICDYHVIPCAAPPWRPGACASYRVSRYVQ